MPEKSGDATAIAAWSIIRRSQGAVELGRWINKVRDVAAVQLEWAIRRGVDLRRGSSLHESRGWER